MEANLNQLKIDIKEGRIELAIQQITQFISQCPNEQIRSEAYYLLGNAYRKISDWQNALNSYDEAIRLNSASPAAQARLILMDILNFFNKDMYNQ